MKNQTSFLALPRSYIEIELWKNVTPEQWNNPVWQLQNSIRTVEQLKMVITLKPHQEAAIKETLTILKKQGKESLRITPYYASLMCQTPFEPEVVYENQRLNKIDPIFWQSVPTPANLFFSDTGKEGAMNETSRSYGAAYQRYPNRVALFVAENTSCASYCVHCQRAKSLDSTADVNQKEINKGLYYISHNQNIDEVLVTGGDALMAQPKRLKYVLEELSKMDHVHSIRIATRVPVVLPMAVTNELLDMINYAANKFTRGFDKQVYFMTHINHYHEITPDLAEAVKRIRKHGFTIRNQTVLLNHVNDSFIILAETFRRMFWIGVHPYYLLQCHKEKGIVHFITPIQIGKIYMKYLQGWISGITIPRYAANIEGGGGKVVLMPSGHDTLNLGTRIDEQISGSSATVNTWDERVLKNYEALGRSSQQEYDKAIEIMDAFFEKKGLFLPKIIIVNEKGEHIKTTNRKNLPRFEKEQKSMLLNYQTLTNGMPVTNPNSIKQELDDGFQKSNFYLSS